MVRNADAYLKELKDDFAAKMSGIEDLPEGERREKIIQIRRELVESADRALANQINEELFAHILNFYDEASR